MDGAVFSFVEAAYEAALDNTLWKGWAEGVTLELGGTGGLLCILDSASKSLDHLDMVLGCSDGVDEYLTTWHVQDPQVPKALSVDRTSIYTDVEYVDRDEEGTKSYYERQIAVSNLDHHMSAVSLLSGGTKRAVLCVHRDAADGITPGIERDKLTAILPGVTRALRLGFLHSELLGCAFWDGLQRHDDRAAILVDEKGRVVRTSLRFEELLKENDGISVVRGLLKAAQPNDTNQLDAIIARAIVSPGKSGAAQVRRCSGRSPYIVVAYPLVRRRRSLAPFEAAALVTVLDPTAIQQTPEHLYRGALGLTRREAELAVLMNAHHSLESAATTMDIAISTARLHLSRVMAKAEVGRQSELIRLLARIGGISLT